MKLRDLKLIKILWHIEAYWESWMVLEHILLFCLLLFNYSHHISTIDISSFSIHNFTCFFKLFFNFSNAMNDSVSNTDNNINKRTFSCASKHVEVYIFLCNQKNIDFIEDEKFNENGYLWDFQYYTEGVKVSYVHFPL